MFLHGTNTVLSEIVPPTVSGNQREPRNGNLGVVFATTSLNMARGYAGQAAKHLGGKPVVLEVSGNFRPWKNRPGCTIFVADKATVVGMVE